MSDWQGYQGLGLAAPEKPAYDIDGSYRKSTSDFPRWAPYGIAVLVLVVCIMGVTLLALLCAGDTRHVGKTEEKPEADVTIRPASNVPSAEGDYDHGDDGDRKTTHGLHVTTTGRHTVPQRDLCRTEVCEKRARSILDYMDETLDPCDDFYKYTCQRGIRNRPVSTVKESWSMLSDAEKETESALLGVLKTLPWQSMKNGAIRKALISFASCENANVPEAEKLQAFETIMMNAGLAQWPLWPPSDNAPSWNETILKMAAETGMTGIISFGAYSEQNVIMAIGMAWAEKEDFRAMLKSSDWMDYYTKSEALRKLDRMELKIGYPDAILNDTLLDKEYEFVGDVTVDTPYVLTWVQLCRNRFMKILQTVRGRAKPLWTEVPDLIDALYDLSGNVFKISAGMLTNPNFGLGLPKACNYGAIGAVIGHEMTHGFDKLGSEFDAYGRPRDWWRKEAEEVFLEKHDCFVDQYSSVTNELTGLKIKGNITSDENIADNGGIRVAYRVYKAYLEKNQDMALPGLEKYTNEQLFFISNGHMLCSLTTPDRERFFINYDSHSPYHQRVNVPMGNMEAFSEAFGCPKGSKMNFDMRCKLW